MPPVELRNETNGSEVHNYGSLGNMTMVNKLLNVTKSQPEHSGTSGTSDGEEDQFEVATNRRSRRNKKRRFASDSLQSSSNPVSGTVAGAPVNLAIVDKSKVIANNSDSQSSKILKKQPVTKIIGKSKSLNVSDAGALVSAAKNLQVKKKIFCVGNLHPNCTARRLVEFISCMGVLVVSVHPAKSTLANNNSYRVCIDADDATIFSNPDNWPDSISVRSWVWKEKRRVAAFYCSPCSPLAMNQNNSEKIDVAEVDIHSPPSRANDPDHIEILVDNPNTSNGGG